MIREAESCRIVYYRLEEGLRPVDPQPLTPPASVSDADTTSRIRRCRSSFNLGERLTTRRKRRRVRNGPTWVPTRHEFLFSLPPPFFFFPLSSNRRIINEGCDNRRNASSLFLIEIERLYRLSDTVFAITITT